MGVKCVRKYQAEDGSLHDDMRAANKHNAQFKLLAALRTQLQGLGLDVGASILHLNLLNYPKQAAALRDTLNKSLAFHREYTGKVAKSSTTVSKSAKPA